MKTILAVAIICFLLIGGVVYVKLQQRPSDAAIHAEVARLITEAGGAEQICREANQIFQRVGTDQLRLFRPEDLADSPAIRSLGTVDGIWPDQPPYIKIRLGNHLRGFLIYVVQLKDGETDGPAGARRVEGCVFVL